MHNIDLKVTRVKHSAHLEFGTKRYYSKYLISVHEYMILSIIVYLFQTKVKIKNIKIYSENEWFNQWIT